MKTKICKGLAELPNEFNETVDELYLSYTVDKEEFGLTLPFYVVSYQTFDKEFIWKTGHYIVGICVENELDRLVRTARELV